MKRSRGNSKSDKDSIQEDGPDSDAEVSFTGIVENVELPLPLKSVHSFWDHNMEDVLMIKIQTLLAL